MSTAPILAAQAVMHLRAQLPVIAVILAGGTGVRAGMAVPKQFVRIAGRPIVAHTIAAFQASPHVDGIVVVRPAAHDHLMARALDECGHDKVLAVVDGGADRMDSTARGLAALADHGIGECKVLVHDGVRPLVDERIIADCVSGLDTVDALDVVIPTADTIVAVDDDGEVVDIPRRAGLRRGQTPQAFLASVLRRAHHAAALGPRPTVTDDCALVAQFCPEIAIGTVLGSEDNIKVTHPQDFLLLDQLFRVRTTSVGQVAGDPALLRGTTVVVMGGTRGIGAAVAEELRRVGARAIVPRRADGFDVADLASVQHVLAEAEMLGGQVDAVVVTAGVLEAGGTADLPLEVLGSVVRTNLWGAVVVAQAAQPFLARSGGQLLFFGSSAYTRGRAGYATYTASKAAVANLTQALADEWHEHGIRVNCLSPARTATDMRQGHFAAADAGVELLDPARVAEVTVQVLASRTTGSIIDMNAQLPTMPVTVDVDRRAGAPARG